MLCWCFLIQKEPLPEHMIGADLFLTCISRLRTGHLALLRMKLLPNTDDVSADPMRSMRVAKITPPEADNHQDGLFVNVPSNLTESQKIHRSASITRD